jgi:hypothetical protein
MYVGLMNPEHYINVPRDSVEIVFVQTSEKDERIATALAELDVICV